MRVLTLIALLVAMASCHVVIDSRINAAIDEDWWKSGVFYQIYPRSFKDSQGNGAGDLKGIIEKLEHLKDLGVTGAWLSPVFKSPMRDGGYDIASFTEVNELFGTNEDLENLFSKAKELGLKIILDFVPNHTSDQHEWFQKSVLREPGFEDYYVWRDCPIVDDEIQYPNNWIAVFHTRAWTRNTVRGQCYLHQFLAAQPDLNYRNPAVLLEMENVLKFWLDRGVDGFRVDAINHMFETESLPDEPYIDINGDKSLYDNLHHIHTRDLQESYETIYDWRKILEDYAITNGVTRKIMMTEAYATIENQIRWYGTASRPGAHMPFNFALISNLNAESNAKDFKYAIDSWLTRVPSFGEANWVMGNHDRSRVGFRYGEERHESLAIMTMLLPGINVVYYGEEILMTDNRAITWEETDDPQACQTNSTVFQEFTRDPVRTPFQWDDTLNAGFSSAQRTWLPVHRNYRTRNLAAQKEAVKSTFKLYQHLIALRKNDIFKNGSYKSVAIGNDLLGFVRSSQGHDSVVVFINLGASKIVNIRDVLTVAEIPQNPRGKILVVNNAANHNIGDYIINLEQIRLGSYDAIALSIEIYQETSTDPDTTTPAGSTTIVASLFLLIASTILTLT